jgi:hypothetical protein
MAKLALDFRTAAASGNDHLGSRGMSDEHPDRGATRRGARRDALRLGVVLGLLAAAALALILRGPLRSGSGASSASACSGQLGAPQARRVQAHEQGALREDVARVVPQRVARLYEEGSIETAGAWTDEEPAGPPVSASATRPGGYEMRWWAPNGDDLVADVWQFADAGRARRFVAMASSVHCRRDASRVVTQTPPSAADLTWLNPDDAAQADVFIRQGARVYRVADAPAGQHGGRIVPGALRRALATIDALACLLPHVRCARVGGNAVPA